MAFNFSSLGGKTGKSGLLSIFGTTVFLLVSACFVTLGMILPSQVSSSLEQEVGGRMIPSLREAFKASSSAIKTELDAIRDATLERVKVSFAAQNQAKGKTLIKTLLPLVENYDFDTAKAILVDAVESDSSMAAIRYRLQADDKADAIGDTSSDTLVSFKVVEKNSFADVELELLATPDVLAQAEEEEKSSFAKIEQQLQASNQALERQILESSHAMQVNTITSLRIRVWLIAAVGLVLLVGVTLLVMQRLVIVPLVRTKQHLLNIAEGDLTQEFDYQSNNELGEMANAMNTMGANLRRIVAEINKSVTTLTSHSDGLNTDTGSVVQGARNQADQATQAASAITELSVSFNEVAGNSSSASESARSATELAQSGREIVSKTSGSMTRIESKVTESSALIRELSRRGEEIGKVVSVINGIAEQTNLLALNAAIEAARAGEQGRGFAVVADEVRTLAGRTSEATQDISRMIEEIQVDTVKSVKGMSSVNEQVNDGVALAKQALSAMDGIVRSSDESVQMATSIATAVEQQSATANEVSRSVESMAMVSHETEKASTSMQQAAEELALLGSELKKTISWFAVKGQ